MNGLTTLPDEEVLAAFVAASRTAEREAAFGELVDRYERRVYAITYRYFGSHSDAQDATQEVFLTILRRAETFRGDSKLSTWVYRVTVNTCTDIARKRKRRPQTPVEDLSDIAGADAGAEDALAGRELAIAVQDALGQLDELSRTLILLVAIEGQGYREVAEALDLPVGTIKSRVHRARARLAELLHDRDDVELDAQPSARSAAAPDEQAPGQRRPRGPPGG